MEKQATIEQVRNLISEAELEKATDTLQEFLQSDSKYNKLYRHSVEIEATLKRTIKEEGLGIIRFDDAKLTYNQVTNDLLNLLEYVETENLNPPEITSPESRVEKKLSQLQWGMILSIVILVGGMIGWRLLKNVNSSDPEKDICPAFPKLESDTFNVFLLPFKSLDNSQFEPEFTIREDLKRFCDSVKLKSRIEISLNREKIIEDYPDKDEAQKLGEQCLAEMVIWGSSEAADGLKSVTAKFRYLGNEEGMAFNKLKWEGENTIDTLKTLSSIARGGELTQDIKTIIAFLAGIIAFEENNPEAAAMKMSEANFKSAEGEQEFTDTAHLIKNMVLADAFFQTGQDDNALKALDAALETHPDYWFARNNRGVLLMKKEAYWDAAEDFRVALKTTKKDSVELLVARGTALQKAKKPVQAKESFQDAKKIDPNTKGIDDKIRSANLEIQIEERKKDRAESRLEYNSRDKQALKTNIEASQNLDSERGFTTGIAKYQSIFGKDAYYFAQQISQAIQKRNYDKFKALVREAQRNNISEKAIIEAKPDLRTSYSAMKKRLSVKN